MSKYKELCEIYTESRKKFSEHQNDCLHYMEHLVQGLVEAFSIPPEKSKLFPVLGEFDPDTGYTVKEAMLLGQDRFWHIGIEITLVCQTCATDPVQPVMINLGIKKEGHIYFLQTSPDKEPFAISEKTPEKLQLFYDNLFDRIKNLLGKGDDTFTEKESTACKIGFRSECEKFFTPDSPEAK